MTQALKNILFRVLQTSSPSGSEEQVNELFASFVSPYVDSVSTDVLGNCIAHRAGNGPKVLIMAHADEVGLMIHYIDDNGYLYFKEIGGIDTHLLPGRRVSIQGINGPVIGIIGKKPIHLQSKSDSEKDLNPEDLWIDIAAKDKDEASSIVEIGSIATFISAPAEVRNNIIVSKSLDDKIGIAILIGIAQSLPKTSCDLYLVASAQEELGARGAQPAAAAIRPDIGIAIDVTHATDYPTMSAAKDGDIILGKGVVISVGPNMNKEIASRFKNLASRHHIAYQLEPIARPTGTDARMIQVAGAGVKTGLLSIPCRYMHTPNEMVSLFDAECAITLISEYLISIDNYCLTK